MAFTYKKQQIIFSITPEEFKALTDLRNFIEEYDEKTDYTLTELIDMFNEEYEITIDID